MTEAIANLFTQEASGPLMSMSAAVDIYAFSKVLLLSFSST